MRAQPSLRTAQAFLFIYIFSLWKGQPSLGQPFFKLAVDMCLFLQIDKDDETVLSELNELEREERARFYGTCLYAQSVEQSLSPDPVSMRLSPDKLKPGKEFTKPYVAFLGHGPTLHFNNVANLISDIKRHHLRIPSSVYELINSEESLILRNHMRHVHSKINSKYLLLGETDSLAPPK
ncbi:hypothetical protein BCR33DRAFT_582094 [Rhizoclosmatium globosum]|uniref:Uncharacterized protein n=1 Tax=Rhizoclosmatium globosum TaxID=329046 RepID=A0A1Y2CQV6_9FUNG|nr:hypothetical protein BCR33DRAFT_582094 [Rhizoclosmatium globosum]|eukprot:ORY49411.1 hypothetical protein BCR33DRAFT_582094 [Rhizoclosmatium globosum]